MRHLALAAAVAILLAGCTSAAQDPDLVTTYSTPPLAAFIVSSPDFDDGGELADWATANAYGGQCTGDNLNPQIDWAGAPAGTESLAIVMIDRSADNFIHWVAFDIPGDIDGVARGGAEGTGMKTGANGGTTPGYFGPCPPGPDHRYEFTVYALDAMLGLEDGARFADIKAGIDAHVLAKASIVGMRSGPA